MSHLRTPYDFRCRVLPMLAICAWTVAGTARGAGVDVPLQDAVRRVVRNARPAVVSIRLEARDTGAGARDQFLAPGKMLYGPTGGIWGLPQV